MIACSETLVQVVCQHKMRVDNLQTLTCGALYDADTPVEISRITLTEVVEFLPGNVGSDVERLVADKHTVQETVGRKPFGRRESAQSQEMPLVVNEMRVAV